MKKSRLFHTEKKCHWRQGIQLELLIHASNNKKLRNRRAFSQILFIYLLNYVISKLSYLQIALFALNNEEQSYQFWPVTLKRLRWFCEQSEIGILIGSRINFRGHQNPFLFILNPFNLHLLAFIGVIERVW